ncbi:MFS transporter [Priestia megaterium]|uniref:MFS transporter n=1 Tax=Priestia megaterium TaxID=1404 RepID=UPI002448B48A|nr:MFS transporter [Priestia megaterium]MDH2363231.1 MFS transporter [Priestia megaterium]
MKDKITLFCLLSTVLLGVMNSFFFHIAVVPISKDLNISIAFSSWFILGYTIMVTIGSIVYSKLAESIQLKKLYLIALVIFVLFSILGYFMNNFYFLILCRLAQGAGGAAFISLTMVAVMDVLDRALLPIGLAFISFAMALGSGLGPLLSGILLSVTNWHILYLFMSCAIIFIPILYLTFPEMKLEKKTPFDWLGMFYLLISILFLLCALNINFLFIVLCIIFFLLFIRHISTISYPIINKKIFNNSSFVRITSLSFLLFLLLGANVFLLSYIFSSILNLNSVQSGGILFISSVMGGMASIVIGKKMNIENVKNFYKIGLYIFFIGYLIIIFGSMTAIVCISVSICCFVAFSFVQMALNYLLDSVLKESKKIYIGIFNLCNFIGMSIGVALFSKLIVVFNMNICFVFLLVGVIIKACMSNSISAVNNKTTGYDYEC